MTEVSCISVTTENRASGDVEYSLISERGVLYGTFYQEEKKFSIIDVPVHPDLELLTPDQA